MRTALLFPVVVSMYAAPSASDKVGAVEGKPMDTARQSRIPVANVALYSREIGRGQPIIVLHGGPDFDHSYLVPDMDRLSDSFRVIYYDQRGRGGSAEGVKPEDVSLASDITDVENVRQYSQLDSVALLGHSWGTVLALEYALRHPHQVSHLLLMNPAPASSVDAKQFRKERRAKLGSDLDRLNAISASLPYKKGDPDAVAAYYRILFKEGVSKPEDLDNLITRLRASFTNERVLKARAIEERLMKETWSSDRYDLLPMLARLSIPTLVIYSDHDFIPVATAAHITHAIPNARMVTLKNCGHFPYLECPLEVRKQIDDFFHSGTTPDPAK